MKGSVQSLPNLGILSQIDSETSPKAPYLRKSVYQEILESSTSKCKS